jgi:2-hydroxychromene-2-carboxylate isomerase
LEFFFDVSSPWTWLAFDRLVPLAGRAGVAIDWQPILVGGVFNAVNPAIYDQRANPNPAKAAYAAKDLQDWARFQGVTINWPRVFPVRSVLAMRACVAAGDRVEALARALFEAYWTHGEDISQPQVVMACAGLAGLDGPALLVLAQSDKVKQQLAANGEDLIGRGGFGSPTIFVNRSDMYFGNDRMALIEAALGLPLQGKAATS